MMALHKPDGSGIGADADNRPVGRRWSLVVIAVLNILLKVGSMMWSLWRHENLVVNLVPKHHPPTLCCSHPCLVDLICCKTWGAGAEEVAPLVEILTRIDVDRELGNGVRCFHLNLVLCLDLDRRRLGSPKQGEGAICSEPEDNV